MHEVGHSLGLRHNFKASTMLRPDQINDTSITRVKGMAGSVMDYNPINIAPKGQKQGDYASTTIGPYDYWAIEYAYKPVEGNEEAELKKIAARLPTPTWPSATDDDFSNNDPQVNPYDLTSDTLAFGKERIAMAAELLKDLDRRSSRTANRGPGSARRSASCIGQFGNGAYLASEYIGGQSVIRDLKGTDKARDPIMPVAGAKQRECLKLLVDQILSDKAFQFSPALLRRLARSGGCTGGNDSFNGPGIDISVLERILGIQKIVLGHCLRRRDPGPDPESAAPGRSRDRPAPHGGSLPLVDRRDLVRPRQAPRPEGPEGRQDRPLDRAPHPPRQYLRRLGSMVLGDRSNPYSDMFSYIVIIGGGSSSVRRRPRAGRLHLKEIAGRIGMVLETRNTSLDDTTRAHLEESKHRIAKVLEANLDIKEP